MNIILTDISGASIFIVPIVPVNTSISANGQNETLNSTEGRFRLIDNQDLKKISWSSFFPVNKNYNFVKTGSLVNGYLYVAFLELMKKYKLPIRAIVTTDKKIPFINMLASIDDFSYRVDRAKDIVYSISLTEFPETFIEFINRGKEIWKYIKELNIKTEIKTQLKKYGLLK